MPPGFLRPTPANLITPFQLHTHSQPQMWVSKQMLIQKGQHVRGENCNDRVTYAGQQTVHSADE